MGCLNRKQTKQIQKPTQNKIQLQDLRALFKDFIQIEQRRVETQFMDFVGPIETKEAYLRQYKGPKAKRLSEQFKVAHVMHYRRVRGDGNCFYTAIGFNMIEALGQVIMVELIRTTKLRTIMLEGIRKECSDQQKQSISEFLQQRLEQEAEIENLFKADERIFYICFQVFIRSLVLDTLEWFKSSANQKNDMVQLLAFMNTKEIMEFERESPELTEIILISLALRYGLQNQQHMTEKYKWQLTPQFRTTEIGEHQQRSCSTQVTSKFSVDQKFNYLVKFLLPILNYSMSQFSSKSQILTQFIDSPDSEAILRLNFKQEDQSCEEIAPQQEFRAMQNDVSDHEQEEEKEYQEHEEIKDAPKETENSIQLPRAEHDTFQQEEDAHNPLSESIQRIHEQPEQRPQFSLLNYLRRLVADFLIFLGLMDENVNTTDSVKTHLEQFYMLASTRQVDAQFKDFIGEKIDKDLYLDQYQGPKREKLSKRFEEANITQYRRVRGDGNCFYTSLGVNIMEQFNLNQIVDLIQKVQLQPLRVKSVANPQVYSQEQSSMIKDFLINQLKQNGQELKNLFLSEDPRFYYCFQIFIRSLVYENLQEFKQSDHEFAFMTEFINTDEILEFEQESPNVTQVIVTFMAIQLKIIITVVSDASVDRYGESEQNGQIKLLFNPGHYEILY